jgi:hypothetical protein
MVQYWQWEAEISKQTLCTFFGLAHDRILPTPAFALLGTHKKRLQTATVSEWEAAAFEAVSV